MTSTAISAPVAFPHAEAPVVGRKSAWMTLLVIAGLALGAVATGAALWWKAGPWAEIVGTGALRTTASESDIAAARTAVIERHRNIVTRADGTRSDPTSNERSQQWRSGPSPDVVRTEVARTKSEIVDKAGRKISIESIRSTGSPTLIILEVSDAAASLDLLNEFADELRKQGVDIE
jgi:hypothetical protein